MLDQRERAEPERGVRVLDAEPNGAAQRGLRTREVRRVGRLPPAQLIREAELREQAARRAAAPAPAASSAASAGRADAAGRSGERPIRERHRSGRRGRGGARLGEDAADEPAESERHRNGAAHEQCRPAPHRDWFAAVLGPVRYGHRMEPDQDVVWITTRRIKDGSYEEFRKAWRPNAFPEGMVSAYECFSEERNEIVGISPGGRSSHASATGLGRRGRAPARDGAVRRGRELRAVPRARARDSER